MPQLILNPGLPGEKIHPLSDGTVTIGRTEDNAIFVLHKSISRKHAQLDVAGARVTLTDLQSKNGTWVNGERIDRRELKPGDQLKCGDVPFSFDAGQPLKAQVAPTMMRELHTHFTRASMAEVRKARPAEPSQRARDMLQTLLQVSQLLSQPVGIDSLLQKILDLTFQILDVDRAAILMVNEQTGELEPHVTKSRIKQPPETKIWSRQIVNFVRERSVAALFSNAQIDARLGEVQSIMAQSICASMCAPLKPRDEVIGVLYVDNLSVPNRFADEDLELMTAFANQAAIAIENSRLYRSLEAEAVLRNNFLRFFPPATIKRLMDSSSAGLGTIDAEVTALFADLSNFTSMSATMHPRAIVELLNEYFPIMSEIVFRHEGTLEKYIGDALLAVWGAPFSHPDDVDRAVRAACEMQRALKELNQRWAAAGKRTLQMHIGLNTGPVAAGNIGSDRYIQYATIGDATNVASRVCSAAGEDQILIADATFQRLKVPPGKLERLPPVKVKGKDEPLTLHRVDWEQS
jgi:adenylate cyclase